MRKEEALASAKTALTAWAEESSYDPSSHLESVVAGLMVEAYEQGRKDQVNEVLEKLNQHNANNKRHVANLRIRDFKQFTDVP